MKRLEIVTIVRSAALLLMAAVALNGQAQQLYKYVDKDGKVSYSDRPPKPGENGVAVGADSNVNVIPGKPAPSKLANPRANAAVAGDVKRRDQARTRLKAEVDAAQKNLDAAKQALEDGRDIRPSEQQIVVRAGGNSIIQKPEYADRIAALEQAVKNAEDRLAKAEDKYRRNAPD